MDKKEQRIENFTYLKPLQSTV